MAQTLVEAQEKAGDDLTREKNMRQAAGKPFGEVTDAARP
jgi:hypothetical protein